MAMTGFRFSISCFRFSIFSLFLLALTACGGGGDGGATSSSEIGTLAYVVTECQDSGNLFSEHQSLHILHGDQDVTVMETPEVGPFFPGLGGLCRFRTSLRLGIDSKSREAFQGVRVSPDGAAVVFEVTDDFSINPQLPLHLPPEQKGIFFVRADGSGLRWLGPPSQLPFFFILSNGFTFIQKGFAFSPDGQTVTFADTGPDAAGNDAAQVFTLDVGSGQRRQVTHLPPGVPPPDRPNIPGVIEPVFLDNQTIGFFTDAYGLTPTGNVEPFTVSLSDGTLTAVPIPATLSDSSIDFNFAITGDKPAAIEGNVQGQPQNDLPGGAGRITEVFATDDANLLQLTNFQRVDTGNPIVDVDRQTVYFSASADPFGTNPHENCQIFSVERLGGSLRQLTQFSEAQHSTSGCFFFYPPRVGCAAFIFSQDTRTGALIFYSSCDPLGTNHRGGQVFAMRPDGSELRQLTHTRGLVTQTGGTTIGELPGPFAYGPYVP